MEILELLEEIEEIVDTSSGVPLTGKIMVDSTEMLQIVKEIREKLPDEIQQAQWINSERDRILGEAEAEYNTIIRQAQMQAEDLVNNNKIMAQAREKASRMLIEAEEHAKQVKMSTYDYVDGILYNFQGRMNDISNNYVNEMFKNLDGTFRDISNRLDANRDEIKKMAYKTSMDMDDISDLRKNAARKAPAEPDDQGYEE